MKVEVEDQFLNISGGTVFVRTWNLEGASQAPIVLLHDSLGSVELWRDFPKVLAAATGRTVIPMTVSASESHQFARLLRRLSS